MKYKQVNRINYELRKYHIVNDFIHENLKKQTETQLSDEKFWKLCSLLYTRLYSEHIKFRC